MIVSPLAMELVSLTIELHCVASQYLYPLKRLWSFLLAYHNR